MKKIFTVLLLAVFVLAQFSMASAATMAGDASITSVPDFTNATSVDVDWAVTGMGAGTKYILIWSRIQADPPAAIYTDCMDIATISGTGDASGTFTYDMTLVGPSNGDVVEFIITVDMTACAGVPSIPVDTDAPMGDVTVDNPFACYTAATWAYRAPAVPSRVRTDKQEIDMWNQVSHCLDAGNPSFLPPQTDADRACQRQFGEQFRAAADGQCRNWALPGPNNTDPVGLQSPGAMKPAADSSCTIL